MVVLNPSLLHSLALNFGSRKELSPHFQLNQFVPPCSLFTFFISPSQEFINVEHLLPDIRFSPVSNFSGFQQQSQLAPQPYRSIAPPSTYSFSRFNLSPNTIVEGVPIESPVSQYQSWPSSTVTPYVSPAPPPASPVAAPAPVPTPLTPVVPAIIAVLHQEEAALALYPKDAPFIPIPGATTEMDTSPPSHPAPSPSPKSIKSNASQSPLQTLSPISHSHLVPPSPASLLLEPIGSPSTKPKRKKRDFKAFSEDSKPVEEVPAKKVSPDQMRLNRIFLYSTQLLTVS